VRKMSGRSPRPNGIVVMLAMHAMREVCSVQHSDVRMEIRNRQTFNPSIAMVATAAPILGFVLSADHSFRLARHFGFQAAKARS
jgi:hypothetical protein